MKGNTGLLIIFSLLAVQSESDMFKPGELAACSDYKASGFDALVFVNDETTNLREDLKPIEEAIKVYKEANPSTENEVSVIPFLAHPCKRIIFAPTKKLSGDTDDSRNIALAARKGMEKAVSMGLRNPVLVHGDFKTALDEDKWAKDKYASLNVVLGAYQGLYTPIEIREAKGKTTSKFDKLSVYKADQKVLDAAFAIEEGRRVGRDIGGSDPERMSAPNIATFIEKEFANHSNIKVQVKRVTKEEYPLMEAVNRAAEPVERHAGRVVKMEYIGEEDKSLGEKMVDLYFVGKGITYDTGGADIKAGGIMAGMHRDKCGAAAVAGFMKTLAMIKPKNVRVHAKMAYVRNSVGEECYVADEIITARSGRRVRVGNTDAEGRMVMTDLICEAKEEAMNVTDPFIFTVATLTGHVVRAYKDYAAVMDNGPAQKLNVAKSIQQAGDMIADPVEISTIRKEDYALAQGKTEYEDIIQCNNEASSATPRGHQFPAAFMIMASGLDKHGRDSSKPIPYTHMDVAGAAGSIHTQPTSSPLMMLTARYVLPRINF